MKIFLRLANETARASRGDRIQSIRSHFSYQFLAWSIFSLLFIGCSAVQMYAQASDTSTDNSSAQSATATASASQNSSQQNSSQIDAPQPADQNNGADNSVTPPNTQGTNGDREGTQTKRILGIVPNFRSVSAGEKLPPQPVKEKFMTATEDSFDYSSIFIPALLAGYSMGTDATPEFHQGAAGYARYFWHAAVDQTSENYLVEFVVPTITREDTRYYTLGQGGFFKRTGYALSRAVITRSDEGNEVFNWSEVVGSGASSGLSSLYYPSRERSFGNTGKEWGLDIAIDGASFVVKEFWPNINHAIFHQKTDSAGAAQK
jgi:hypothetical protein